MYANPRSATATVPQGTQDPVGRGVYLDSEEQIAQAIADIGNDGVVVIRPDGVETVDLKIRKKTPPPKGTNRRPPPPRASDELVAGYRLAAEMAEQRRLRSLEEKRDREAKAWAKIARYCAHMADRRLVDASDQRSSYVMPMDAEQMDVLGVRVLWSQQESTLDEWQRLALESALSTLSEMERVCYEAKYGARLVEREIAKAAGITHRDVWKYLKRATNKLKVIQEKTRR